MAKKRKKAIHFGTRLIIILLAILIFFGSIYIYSLSTGKSFSSIFEDAFALPSNEQSNTNTATTTPTKYSSIESPTGQITNVSTLKDLKIHFVDVGQGDCIIIEFPDNKKMIIDAGNSNTSVENAIKETCTNLNITKFDYLLLTHQDADHVGSMDYVIENYEISYIFRPNVLSKYSGSYKNITLSSLPQELIGGKDKSDGGTPSTTQSYFKFLVDSYLENCDIQTFNKDSDFTNSITYDNINYSYTINFLTPTSDRNSIAYDDANNYSPIILLEYCGKKILLTGDAEEAVETEFLNYYNNTISDYNVDVLKVGHHGSLSSSSNNFINAINPEFSIIQVGYNNSYKHPIKSTLNRLNSFGNIYRNDTNGNITLSISTTGEITESSFQLENSDCSDNNLSGEELVTARTSEVGLNNFDSYIKFYYVDCSDRKRSVAW